LNEYIGNGQPWDLDRLYGGVHILPPYQKAGKSDWYKGTANAIYQNLNFMQRYDPEYVLILSGDHIYKMDYEKMLQEHIDKDASLTVSVMEVPIKEASRFGIMNTDDNGRIIEFEEKPAEPKSNLASMGIYIFTWKRLREFLTANQSKGVSVEDFGNNVIPGYIDGGDNVFVYRFSGYWKDVGTIASLHEANMEFLEPNNALNIYDKSWRIYSRNAISTPHFITSKGLVHNAMIGDGCYVDGTVVHSIISQNVEIHENATVEDSFIMSGSYIGKNVTIKNAIVGEFAHISDNVNVIGTEDDIAVVGHREVVGEEKEL
jgi:glucose-1-phosphate adenylyltransferase